MFIIIIKKGGANMPNFDGTGPRGKGSGTGRGRGKCRGGAKGGKNRQVENRTVRGSEKPVNSNKKES